MRLMRVSGLGLGLVFGLVLGVLPYVANDVAAQTTLDIEGNCNVAILCSTEESQGGDGGDATSSGGHGGDAGIASVHDVATALKDASSSVVIGSLTTGDAVEPNVDIDARILTDPVLAIAGSFTDEGRHVLVPAGSGDSHAGTAGGNGLTADDSGGAGRDAAARGRGSGDSDR